MNEQDWAKVQTVFELVLNADHREHARIIDRELGDQPELAEKVRKLLAEDAADSTFGGAEAAASVLDLIDRLSADEVVGRYRIVKRIGEGGMGSVYLAKRSDDTFDKQVALKLIRGDLSEQALERFSIERQALAQLEHVNIARLLDGGVDEQSRPYVAMEYVDGLPITHHCDQLQLSINVRIGLFIDLCDAVQHAHRNLIVHRDIKPSNVLVTSEGTVKLLDFGIAKLLGPGQQQALTATAARVLTPDYASPEQVTGGAITTATDVYQLGVLLYELLCGLRPLDTGQLTPSQFEAALLKGDITAPSRFTQRVNEGNQRQLIADRRNVSAERLSQSLQGDLDTIVRKAMAPEPGQRYASPVELAADLKRYIEGLPIEARPASLGYRTRKFIGRNKLSVSIAAGIVAMVIGFTAYLIEQAEQIRVERDTAQRERDTAEQEKERAEAVTDFLVDTFSQANPLRKSATEVSAADILNAGERQANSTYADDPALRSKLMTLFGTIHIGLGDDDEAERYLVEAVSASRDTAHHSDDASAIVGLAKLFTERRRYEKAKPWMEELETLKSEMVPNDLAQYLLLKAYTAKSEGRSAASLKFRKMALEIADRELGPGSDMAIGALSDLLSQYYTLDDWDNTKKYQKELQRRYDTGDLSPPAQLDALSKILTAEHDMYGWTPSLVDRFSHQLKLSKDVNGQDSFRYHNAAARLAGGYRGVGRFSESLELLTAGLAFHIEHLPNRKSSLGTYQLGIARTLAEMGRVDEAREYFEKAVTNMADYGPSSPGYAVALTYFGLFLATQDERPMAMKHLSQAISIYEGADIKSELYHKAMESVSKLGNQSETL